MNEKSTFYKWLDRIALWAIAAFALECILGCSGQWLSFHGFSIRMVLFTLCFLLSLPNVFSRLRELIRSPFVGFTLLFGFYLLVAAVIGWRRSNNPGFIIADITGLLTLALVPGFLATVHSRKRVEILMDVVFCGTLILGAFTTFMHFYFAFMPASSINALNSWLNSHAMGGLSTLQTGMQRIYLRSHIFLQVGLLLGLYKLWFVSGWKRLLLIMAEGIILFACLMTYTRGFWLGFLASALLLLVLSPQNWKKYLISVGAIAIVLVGLFSLSSLSYGKPVAFREVLGRFNPALIEGAILPDYGGPEFDPSTDPTEDPSVDEAAVNMRRETLQKLMEKIRMHPVLGNGLGTNLDGLREDGKTEYMYHDVFMKMGLVGFLLFLSVFFLPTLRLVWQTINCHRLGKKIPWESQDMHNIVLAAAFLGVAITSYVNPFMTNPMGILLVLVTAAAARQAHK